jgi:hypothetical protein
MSQVARSTQTIPAMSLSPIIAIEGGNNKTRQRNKVGMIDFPSEWSFAVDGREGLTSKAHYRISVKDEETIYLYHPQDIQIYGMGDPIRLNTTERYLHLQWLNQVKAALIAAFDQLKIPAVPTNTIEPWLAVTVPVAVFQNEELRAEVKSFITAIDCIEDGNGRIFKLRIHEDRCWLLPESGAAMLWHDQNSRLREGVVYLADDAGRGTTDYSKFVGNRLVPKSGRSQMNQGLGTVVQAIHQRVASRYANITDREVEQAFRSLAGKSDKAIIKMRDGAIHEDVSDIYFEGLAHLLTQHTAFIINNYKMDFQVLALMGGGAYHMGPYYQGWTKDMGVGLEIVKGSEFANLNGAFLFVAGKANMSAIEIKALMSQIVSQV